MDYSRNINLQVQVTLDMREDILRLSAARGASISSLVREAICRQYGIADAGTRRWRPPRFPQLNGDGCDAARD